MEILSKFCKGKHCFGMIDLANSTKNLSVNSVALSVGTFKKWGRGGTI